MPPVQAPHHECQVGARFTATGHDDALPTFLEVLEQEAKSRFAIAASTG